MTCRAVSKQMLCLTGDLDKELLKTLSTQDLNNELLGRGFLSVTNAFPRPSCHENYHIDLKLFLQGEQLKGLSPKRPEQ